MARARQSQQDERDEVSLTASPWASAALRHEEDIALRSLGFSIHSRPKAGPTLWLTRERKVVTHAEAVMLNRKTVEAIVQGLRRELSAQESITSYSAGQEIQLD